MTALQQALMNAADEFGTPLYVYDAETMQNQFKRMTAAFSVKRLKINYACKALSNINIVKLFNQMGSGVDAVSIQEVAVALKAGVEPQSIVFTPNGVSLQELSRAAEWGVRINIDNINMLETFARAFPDKPVGIRINPHIMAGGNAKISVGHIDSKFGISFHQVPLVERLVKNLGIKIEGIHMHTGSDILDPDVFLQGAEILFDVAKRFDNIDYIDFGSGFKVPYRPTDPETDIETLGEKVSARFNEFCAEYGKDLCLMFEPGKFLVSNAGYFLAKVNVVKQTTSTVFAGVDTGLNHFIRPMFYDAYHHIENLSNLNGRKRIYTVVGYICETDTLGYDRTLGEVNEGDILCLHNAGAYCAVMASNYNSRFRPAEVLWMNNELKLIRKREDLESILANQIEVI